MNHWGGDNVHSRIEVAVGTNSRRIVTMEPCYAPVARSSSDPVYGDSAGRSTNAADSKTDGRPIGRASRRRP